MFNYGGYVNVSGTADCNMTPEQIKKMEDKYLAQQNIYTQELEIQKAAHEKKMHELSEVFHKHTKTTLDDLMARNPDFFGANTSEWLFYGVCDNTIKISCPKCGQILFVTVLEDESDGYRSMLGEIEVTRKHDGIFFDAPLDTVSFVQTKELSYFTSPFEGYFVIGTDKHVWVEFGTENFDDYYPEFIFKYNAKEPNA